MSKYFGTDGFRGLYGVELTQTHAYQIGCFIGSHFKDGKILIGKDTRISGNKLEKALCDGITDAGADAYIIGVTTTPSVAYLTRVEHFDCGVMISASHNPYYDNGIKLINSKGEKMDETTILEVENYIDNPEPLSPTIPGKVINYEDGINEYIQYLLGTAKQSFKGKTIALDCAYGSASPVAKVLFEQLGATVIAINAEPDGTNINHDCGSTHMENIQNYVKEHDVDAGFAFDGDADRCLAVDELGNIINGDQIIYALATNTRLTNNEVVITTMSNAGLLKVLKSLGIEYHQTDVGDKYVYEYMSKNGNELGGEQSGHIILREYATTGDGLLTAIKVLEVMVATDKTLSELTKDCVMYPQTLINVRVMDKHKALNDPDVQASIRDVADELGDRGRILVRCSGTESLVRVMVEAKTKDICNDMCDKVVQVIKTKGFALTE